MQRQLPIGPVRALTAWMESAGCLIVAEPLGTRIDGMSQWSGEHPVVLLSATAPVHRRRLTLAHELGHLVLHTDAVSDDVEREANAFAAEFLMPAEVIKPQLRNLTLGKLIDPKREWGTSMQALIERARSLQLLSNDERSQLYKQMSARGWRTREPASDELVPEIPRLASVITNSLLDRGLGDREVARLAGYATRESMGIFRPESPGACNWSADGPSNMRHDGAPEVLSCCGRPARYPPLTS